MLSQLPALKKLKKIKKFIENPIEAGDPTGIVKGVGESLKNDVAGQNTVRDMWKQIYLPENEKKHQQNSEVQMHEGEEIDLTAHQEEKKDTHIEAGIEYHREITHYAERAHNREVGEVAYKVQEIVAELQRLIDSSSSLIKAEYQEVAVMQAPSEVGKYHINFFEWMLNVIRNARLKVEDSGAWLTAMQGKKGKKNYWAMFKKHGTTFGMSNERQVATQTG